MPDELRQGHNLRKLAIAIFALARFIGIKASCHNDGAHGEIKTFKLIFQGDRLTIQVNRLPVVVIPVNRGCGWIAARISLIDDLATGQPIIELIRELLCAGRHQLFSVIIADPAGLLLNMNLIVDPMGYNI